MMENAAISSDAAPSPLLQQWRSAASQRAQRLLDRWAPFPLYRWIGLVLLALIYAVRVYFLQGFYIITYALGIYILGLLISFLSPQVDPELEGPVLPTKQSDEFRPFIRRLPEFKFWYSLVKAVSVAFFLTFFPVLDVPVFWPILVVYWVLLAVITMKKQIMHMIKHRYVPFSIGKQRYSKRPSTSSEKAPEEIPRTSDAAADTSESPA